MYGCFHFAHLEGWREAVCIMCECVQLYVSLEEQLIIHHEAELHGESGILRTHFVWHEHVKDSNASHHGQNLPKLLRLRWIATSLWDRQTKWWRYLHDVLCSFPPPDVYSLKTSLLQWLFLPEINYTCPTVQLGAVTLPPCSRAQPKHSEIPGDCSFSTEKTDHPTPAFPMCVWMSSSSSFPCHPS